MRLVSVESQIKVRVVKETDENSCDVLTAESEKDKYSDAWLLDSMTIFK